MGLEIIEKISHIYGSNPEYVLAGGGNTSFKDEDFLYIKGSGTSLATITSDGFVKMSREALGEIWKKSYSFDKDEREKEVLSDMMGARCKGEEGKRPSVETLLHNLFKQQYVLHVHPTMINGVTCSQNGEKVMSELFPDAIWIKETEPGYVLASKCRLAIEEYETRTNKDANLLFLQNHGIFFASNTEEEMDLLVSRVVSTLKERIKKTPDLTEVNTNKEKAAEIAPILRMAYDKDGACVVRFTLNKEVERLCQSKEAFSVLEKPMSPDHIVYCKAAPLFLEKTDKDSIINEFKSFEEKHGYLPKIAFVKKIGMFAIGKNAKDVKTVTDVWLDAVKISVFAESFGGVRHMADDMVDFIVNWEVESYRSKVALKGGIDKKLSNKIAIVTGGAKGFGKEISKSLVSEGAIVVIADIDESNGVKVAESLGKDNSKFIKTDVTSDDVKNLIIDTVLSFGGLDIFVNNAGIIKAGTIEETEITDFENIADVNYTSYFRCVKEAIKPMKLQNSVNSKYLTDIVEINSKSGISGSAMNFAYSGSKFGAIGLTQSFALELCPYGIKVNAVCPGNYLDGELWSDKENGLLVQFLKAGKVPGAKTVEDVRAFYECKVPLKRGCLAEDVCRAVIYAIEQKYETGQAIPVTGGQQMLN